MKVFQILCVLINLFFLLLISACYSEAEIGFNGSMSPIAEWVKLDNKNTQAQQFLNLQKLKAPTQEEVGIPAYPNSKLFVINKNKCYAPFTFLALVSENSPETVVEWYKSKLTEYGHFQYQEKDIFINNTETFDPNLDAHVFTKKRNIMISSLIKPFKKALPEYRTYIEIHYPNTACIEK